jgi:dUTP pyrophosphatase
MMSMSNENPADKITILTSPYAIVLKMAEMEEKCQMMVERMYPDVKMLTRYNNKAAGLDIYAYETQVIQPGKSMVIKTGIKITLPEGTYGQLVNKSSLSFAHQLLVLGGVLDQDFTGEILVGLQNLNSSEYTVKKYQAIAQIIVIPILKPAITEAEIPDNADRSANMTYLSTLTE